jgi:hypothetical protein
LLFKKIQGNIEPTIRIIVIIILLLRENLFAKFVFPTFKSQLISKTSLMKKPNADEKIKLKKNIRSSTQIVIMSVLAIKNPKYAIPNMGGKI